MKPLFERIWTVVLCLLPLLAWSGCDLMHDEADACTTRYQVQFVADKNLNFADAFEQEVETVTLYVYDARGALVWTQTASGDALRPASGKYAMDISTLAPGRYHLVAWGGLEASNAFTVPELDLRSDLDALTCTLTRTSRADQPDLVDYELDDLFHGMIDIEIPETDAPGVVTFSIQLTKDTNNVTVVLQQLDSTPMSVDDYEFIITANNGHLNHDNTLINDEQPFTYAAWMMEAGTAGVLYAPAVRSESESYSTVVAHLTTSRLVVSERSDTESPVLTIRHRDTGQTVLSVPLIDYALMVRSHYTRVSDSQDYLDRQSDYSMTFFLVNGQWMTTRIIINDWIIRLQDDTVQ
jgi:hypothetical protein